MDKPFQFPPPRGGEPPAATFPTLPVISIPAPARGRTSYNYDTDGSYKFQFPPPRGGEPHALIVKVRSN